MKKFLCVILCLALAASVFAFAGCGDNSSDIDALKKQIQELQDALEKSNSSFSDEIESLKNQLEIAQTKILLLEGKVDGDPDKVYKLGETVTYSSNGLKLFSIKVDAVDYTAHNNLITCQITYTNHNLYAKLPLDDIYSSISVDANNNVNRQLTTFTHERYIVSPGSSITLGLNGNSPLYFDLLNKTDISIFFGLPDKSVTPKLSIPFARFDIAIA